MKKITAIILSVIFVFASFSVSAFADEAETIANINDAMGYARSSDPVRIEKAVLKSGEEAKIFMLWVSAAPIFQPTLTMFSASGTAL